MGALTTNAQVWYPGSTDSSNLITLLSTMASSIENGLGNRVKNLEAFVGVNLGLSTAQTISGGVVTLMPFGINQTTSFNEGMTVNANGSVTVITAGMYQVNLNANFLPANTTAARVNTYLYKNGSTIAFSATYGEINTSRYSNSNIVGVYKFAAGDVVDIRCSNGDSNIVLQAGGGSCFSMALTARL